MNTKLLSLISRINLQLPPYSVSLFSMIFISTIAFQYIQTNKNISQYNVRTSITNSTVAKNLPINKNISLRMASANESEKTIYTDEKINNQDRDTRERTELVSRVKNDEAESARQDIASLNPGYDQQVRTQQRVYIPGGGRISNSSSVSNNNSSSFSSNTNLTNISSGSSVSQSDVSTNTPQEQAQSSQQIEENMIAQNEVNTRAQELYEQRRQNVCNGVIARVGTNPVASDFNSIGEYYRLRDGYRCF